MATLRLYRSPAFGITSRVGHVYIYDPKSRTGYGEHGSGGFRLKPGPYGGGTRSLRNPYATIKLPRGYSSTRTLRKIKSYPGWNKGIYIPYVNDCHTQLESAFEYAKIPYPRDLQRRVELTTVEEPDNAFVEASQLFFNAVDDGIYNSIDSISNLLKTSAENNHNYHSRTGRLENSLVIKKTGPKSVEIYSTAPYADDVIQRKGDYMTQSVIDNKDEISNILDNNITNSINAILPDITQKVTEVGYNLFTLQLSKLF